MNNTLTSPPLPTKSHLSCAALALALAAPLAACNLSSPFADLQRMGLFFRANTAPAARGAPDTDRSLMFRVGVQLSQVEDIDNTSWAGFDVPEQGDAALDDAGQPRTHRMWVSVGGQIALGDPRDPATVRHSVGNPEVAYAFGIENIQQLAAKMPFDPAWCTVGDGYFVRAAERYAGDFSFLLAEAEKRDRDATRGVSRAQFMKILAVYHQPDACSPTAGTI